MKSFIFDAYAWIEYFKGTKKGEQVKLILDEKEKNEIITVECTVAEIRSWTDREGFEFEQYFQLITANSQVESVNLDNWVGASKIRTEMRKERQKFGLIDALLLAKQKELGKGKVVSGDKHFDGLPNCVFLQES